MSRKAPRAADEAPGPSRAPGAAPAGGVSKRKAVPPGYLGGLLHARHHLKSVGLGAREAGPPAGKAATAPAPAAPAGGVGAKPAPIPYHYVPAKTLPLLFAQRKRYLQKHGDPLPKRGAWRVGDPAGLLSLPEDVLLRVVCYLKHDEIPPLFQVCKPLRATLRRAVAFHFNYQTPFRPPGDEAPPLQPRQDRRRAVTQLADVMSRLNRPLSSVAVQAAPRALTFNPDDRCRRPLAVPD